MRGLERWSTLPRHFLGTSETLPRTFLQAHDLEKALAVAAAMRRRGLTPTTVTYNTLLDGCARARNLTLAAATLAELRAAGLAPSERPLPILIPRVRIGGVLCEPRPSPLP